MSGRKQRLSTHDMGAAYCGPNQHGDTEYAAIEFENLVRQARSDGRISREEAVALIERHTLLQRNSRDSLSNILKALMPRAEYLSIRQDIYPPVTKTKIIYRQEGPEPDVDYDTKSIGLNLSRPKLSQKVTWLSIVGPAVLVSLLGVLGVI